MPKASTFAGAQGGTKRPKIFLLGFNKCGTRSFNTVFQLCGIRAAHWRVTPAGARATFVAKKIEQNVACGRDPINGLEDYDAFSDLTYVSPFEVLEANKYFRELHAAHPDGYFILNTRNVNNWILSRIRHRLRARASSFWDRSMSATGLSRLEILAWWENEFVRHHVEVQEYFAGNPRFMEFDIERDDFGDVSDFLKADYTIDLQEWGNLGGHNQARQDKRRFKRSLDNVRTKRLISFLDLFNATAYSFLLNKLLRRE